MDSFDLKTQQKELYNALITAGASDSDFEVTIKKVKKGRTLPQNRAIHLYCTMMADDLNAAGYDFNQYVDYLNTKGMQVSWTPEIFKREVWHRIQAALYKETVIDGEVSTKNLTTEMVTVVYEHVNNMMASKGVSHPFPDKFGGSR